MAPLFTQTLAPGKTARTSSLRDGDVMSPGLTLVTGANGFVGTHVCNALEDAGLPVRKAVRQRRLASDDAWETGSIGRTTDWSDVIRDVDTVVHLAARVHHIRDAAANSLEAFRSVNAAGTKALAEAAERAGVRRFVFMSTVKVHGESTNGRPPYTEADEPAPADAYAISKLEAERILRAFSGLAVTILRPPLVYGPGVGANFLRLLRLVDRGVPIPLPATPNRRSIIYVGNLADAVLHCARHREAAGRTLLVSDGAPVSTAELVRELARSLHRRPHVVTLPRPALNLLVRLAGRRVEFERIAGDLEIDSSEITRITGWSPPMPASRALSRTCEWYVQQVGR